MTVTAIVHTKNSAKTLETCLRSLSWCSEVWVVDMESTDSTVDIAKREGAHVFAVKAPHRFADPVRNEYLKKVKTEWTLIIDSDEEVPETLAEKLKECMMTQGVNGYRVPRKNIIFGKWVMHTGFWPDYIIRFFRTGTCDYPAVVHGQPHVVGKVEDIPAREEYALIHHHYESVEQYLLRLNVYTTLEVEKISQRGELPNLSGSSFLSAFFSEFHRRFFAQKGYLDGAHGLVLSLLQSVYQMVVVMKLWEMHKKDVHVRLDDIELDVMDACRSTSYWVANEKITHGKNPLHKLIHTVKRKIHS